MIAPENAAFVLLGQCHGYAIPIADNGVTAHSRDAMATSQRAIFVDVVENLEPSALRSAIGADMFKGDRVRLPALIVFLATTLRRPNLVDCRNVDWDMEEREQHPNYRCNWNSRNHWPVG